MKIDEPPSVVYSPWKEMKNKILNYKEIVSSVDTNDDKIYGTSIKCHCEKHEDFGDENHGHVLTGDLNIF